jgi:hypothetical protein
MQWILSLLSAVVVVDAFMHAAPQVFPGLVHNHAMYRVAKVAVVLITFQLAMALLKCGRPRRVAK